MQAMNLPHSAAAVVVCTSIKAFYSRFIIERQTRAFISRNSTSLSDLTEENLHWKSRRVFIQSCIREKICTIYALKRHLRTFALSPQPTQEDVHPSSAMKIKTCSVRQVYEFIALCMDDEVRKWIFRKLTNRHERFFSFVDIFRQATDSNDFARAFTKHSLDNAADDCNESAFEQPNRWSEAPKSFEKPKLISQASCFPKHAKDFENLMLVS